MTTPMPTWDQFMAPVLRILLDGQVRARRELFDLTASAEGLTDAHRAETLSSGQLKYENRIGWATSCLDRFSALSRPARGRYLITDIGRKLLNEHPGGITEKHLRALAGDERAPHTWYALKAKDQAEPELTAPGDLDPDEMVEQGNARIQADVTAGLLKRIHDQSPAFFEEVVLKLITEMGYAGRDGRAVRTQLSNDGGIDGIIDQDGLGLERVHVQAKRYTLDTAVGRPEIQAFVGALAGSQGTKGIFITTGRFSSSAREYVAGLPTRVALIDGQSSPRS